MGCKGLCHKIAIEIGSHSLDELPDVRRCAICGENIHSENWVHGKSGRIRCPCCNFQLRIHSRGNKSRKRRQLAFEMKSK